MRCNIMLQSDTPSHALKTFTFVCDQADHVAAMQAQLLPTSADLPATTTTAETVQTILGVKALLAQLVRQAHDAPGVLEALAALLEASNSQSGVQAHAEHVVQRLHFVHLAVKTLQEAVAQSAVCMDLFCAYIFLQFGGYVRGGQQGCGCGTVTDWCSLHIILMAVAYWPCATVLASIPCSAGQQALCKLHTRQLRTRACNLFQSIL